MQKRRPLAPLIAGYFLMVAALICLATSVTLLAPGSILDGMWAIKPDAYRQLKALAPWSGIGFLVLVAVTATASYGAFARATWAWRLIVVMAWVNGAGDAAQIAFGQWLEGAIGVIAALLILYALTRPPIKASFRK